MKRSLFEDATKEGFKNLMRILAVWTWFGVLSVIPELRCGQHEVTPSSYSWGLDADFDLFGIVQLQLEIYMNLCSLFFNTWNVISKTTLENSYSFNLNSVE